MRKLLNHGFILTVLFLSLGVISYAQETGLNERHLEYNNLLIYGSVLSVDDSTFIVVGTTRDSVEFEDLGIIRAFNLEGIERWRTTIEDTVSIRYFDWPSLTRTIDSNYVTMGLYADGYPYYHITKFDYNGDTLFSKRIDELWNLDSAITLQTGVMVESPVDSSLYINLHLTFPNSPSSSCFTRLDKNGNLISRKYFQPYGIFNRILHGAIAQINDTTFAMGVLEMFDASPNVEDRIQRNAIVFVDTAGNEYYRWTDVDNQHGLYIRKIFPTAEGGLIFIRVQGEYYPNDNSIKYKGNVVKLDANLQVVWDSKFGYRHAGIIVEDAIMLDDSSIVVVGSQPSQIDETPNNQIYGWMVKLDKYGTVLWERRYVNVSHQEDPLNNRNKLRAVDQLPNGGFVAVGEARNGTNINNNQPGQFGWLITTDSLGCIVPGCQYLSSEDPEKAPAFKMYPNPANEKVNIFYDGKAPGTLIIRDMNGKEVKTVPVGSDAATYIIPISHLSSGVYSVVIESGGKVVVKEKLVKE